MHFMQIKQSLTMLPHITYVAITGLVLYYGTQRPHVRSLTNFTMLMENRLNVMHRMPITLGQLI